MIQKRKLITEYQFPKGPSGVKEILNFLKNNGSVAMLVDQKLSNGVKVKFFWSKRNDSFDTSIIIIKIRISCDTS